MTNHRLVLRTHDGEQLAILQDLVKWELTRVENGKGWFTITASKNFDPRWLGVDRLIEFWRQPIGGEDGCLGVGFMRYWEWFEQEEDGREVVRFGGPDQVELVERHIVGYQANTANTSKTGAADDVSKAIIRENYVFATAGNDSYGRPRGYPAANFECDPDEGAGFVLTRAFAWRNTLPTIQELAESSRSHGVPLFFDVIPDGPARFRFRTWVNVRGIDRTISTGIAPILFSKAAGNLGNPMLRFDYRNELSYVFGGGQGEGPTRTMDHEASSIAVLREGESIWNKREAFQDARECGVVLLCIGAKAYRRLQQHRAKVIFKGALLDMPQSKFGIDWNFGDKVSSRYRGFDFDGHVRSFTISVDENKVEKISARMDVTEYAYGSPR